MHDTKDVLIVGGGHGGAQAAISLRQHGFDGSIAIVTDEDEFPYQRPPLSKTFLSDAVAFDRILIRPAKFWADHGVELLRGRRAVTVRADRHVVGTDRGEAIGYRWMIWAAGSTARRLSCAGHDLAGLHTVRTRADVERIKTELAAVSQVVVIGAGYVGLETAAALTKLGRQVTVLESLNRVLARVTAEPISRFYEAEHRARGVDVRVGCEVAGFEGERGRVTAVRLAGGARLPCDLAIVGIGATPAIAPLVAAGAAVGTGVLVDEQARTSLPDIFAIGDCAMAPSPYAGGRVVRLESVQNAVDQAAAAARALAGSPAQTSPVPTFWSDQYDLKLRTAGIQQGHDTVIVRGEPESRSFSVIYMKDRRVTAIDSVNKMKDFAQGRALIQSRVPFDPAEISDPARSLSAFLAPHGGAASSQGKEPQCLHT